jgi:hypothetical protein
VSMSKVIVTFAGHPGSGKTTAVGRLERDFGFTSIRPQLAIKSYAEEHNIVLGKDRSLWVEVKRRINEERGPDWITQAVLSSPAGMVVMDALRTIGDYRVLNRAREHNLVKVAFVGLFCPPEIRYQHIIESNDFDKAKPSTFQEFLAQEIPEYYSSEGEYGMATQTILDLTPPELRIEYTTESKEVVGEMILARLKQGGYLATD